MLEPKSGSEPVEPLSGERQCGSPEIINCLLNQLARVGGEHGAPSVCSLCNKSERDLNRELRVAGQFFKSDSEPLPESDREQIDKVEQQAIDATSDSTPPQKVKRVIPEQNNGDGRRFIVARSLGNVGLGQVSIAKDRELPRHVAYKHLLDEYSDNARTRVRFLREAKIAGRLEHSGVPPIYSLGHSNGRPYYASRLIDGEPLNLAIARFHENKSRYSQEEYQLEMDDLLRRFLSVCDTIAYAHFRGIMHRGIKPESIMLGEHGETIVIDWDLATFLDPDEPEVTPEPSTLAVDHAAAHEPLQPLVPGLLDTYANDIASIPGLQYMSPEMACCSRPELSQASDVFALGATLHTIVSGKPPFDTASATYVADVQNGNLNLANGLPAPVDAICRRAMARLPHQRYGSVTALADDVRRYLADLPVRCHDEPLAHRLKRSVRNNAGLALVALLALVAALIVSITIHLRS